MMVGVVRVCLKGCAPCCWIERIAVVEERETLRVELEFVSLFRLVSLKRSAADLGPAECTER